MNSPIVKLDEQSGFRILGYSDIEYIPKYDNFKMTYAIAVRDLDDLPYEYEFYIEDNSYSFSLADVDIVRYYPDSDYLAKYTIEIYLDGDN